MTQHLPYLKYFLWWIGIIRNCPRCGSNLIRMDKGGWNLYKCANRECDFGKKRTHYRFEIWKA